MQKDPICGMIVDEKKDILEVKKKFPASQVDRLVNLMKANEHKKLAPPSPEFLF